MGLVDSAEGAATHRQSFNEAAAKEVVVITLPYRFMLTGIVFAVIGMAFGIWIGTTGPSVFNYASAHAHINLVGWVTMFLFGLWYRGTPALAETTLAGFHYWIALVGVVCLVLGIIGSVAPSTPLEPFVIPGALLTLISMLIFLWTVWQGAQQKA